MEVLAETMLRALEGRLKPDGEIRPAPSFGAADGSDDGCYKRYFSQLYFLAKSLNSGLRVINGNKEDKIKDKI